MKTTRRNFYWVLIFCLPVQAISQEYLVPANQEGRYGFIDTAKAWAIREKFDKAFPFCEGVAAVSYYGKWGYIDRSGKWIIQPAYSDAKPFSEGLACVMSNGKGGFIDHAGNWVIEPQYFAVSSFSEGKAVIFTEQGFQFIDKEQRDLLGTRFKIARPFSEGAAYVVSDDDKGFIDHRGNWLFKTDYDDSWSFSEGMAMVMKSGKYGFIDRRGNLVIPLSFRDGTQFSEGMASVKIGKRWGYINKDGKVMIQPAFDYAGPFNFNYAPVRKDGHYGLIDQAGDWVIEPDFMDLGEMSKTSTLKEEVERMVTDQIRNWEIKGEFEKTPDYLQRVDQSKRDKEIQGETHKAINYLAGKYVKLGEAELGLYNADAEMFNLIIPGALPTLIPVPLDEAKWFKDNWNHIKLTDADYSIKGETFLITRLSATLGDTHYEYDASSNGVPAGDFEMTADLGQIVITIPNLPVWIKDNPVYLKKVAGTSDVDVSIPVNPVRQSNVFAVIIGNEDYSAYQVNGDGDINVDFAESDARTFKEYMTKTFGVPEENITLLVNATAGQINQSLAKLSALARAYEGKAELIFYYAGHGLPDEKTQEPYLIPVDVSSSDLTYAISLESVFNKLTENPSKRVTVFLDACFSGGGRNQSLVASRGIRIRPKSPFVMGNLVVFSASSGDESAYAYNEKGHGMFTYHLLKEFQESKGLVTYGSLAHDLQDEVNKKSLVINNRKQIPTVNVSPIFENDWQNFTFLPVSTGK